MNNLTDKFIDFICAFRYEDLSVNALHQFRVCLIDTIGVTIAGASELFEKNKLLLLLLNNDSSVINPIGISQKTSLANAILINGINAHFLELDDGIRFGVIHPSAPLFSALIPVAIAKKVSWKQFVLGAICGYETSIRLANAMQPSHYSSGFHPTATCCTIGVAVGLSVMLGYNKKEIKDAFSTATISSYGTLKVLEDTSQLKPYNCGKAALLGYYAAILAKAGFCGPNDALSGNTGFFHMMCNQYDENILFNWENIFAIEKVYLKPYASCRHTHPEIEAAIILRHQNGFNIENIKSITVTTYKGVIGKHDSNVIYGESSARMSIPYSLAVALYTGKAGIEEFTDQYINHPIVQKITKMCIVKGDDQLSKLVPDKRIAKVEIQMSDGLVFTQQVDFPKGEPENPITENELKTKFLSMTSYAGIKNEIASSLFKLLLKNNKIEINQLAKQLPFLSINDGERNDRKNAKDR